MAGGAKRWIEAGKGNDRATDLTKYVESLKSRLASPVSTKHASNPESYHAFLRKEINLHSQKIESLRLSEPAKK